MTDRAAVLDVRPLPHDEKHGQAFRFFDALAPGEAFVLVSDHEPLGLLREFQARRACGFEWNVLERGPETFRIQIERRSSATPRDVSEFLGRDHDRLDAIFSRARQLADSRAGGEARTAFQEFSHGLIRHISMEENLLFPAFERATGGRCGPTTVLQSEHRQIGRLLEEATAALSAGDARRFGALAADLHGLLSGHNESEEAVVYPVMDRSLAGERERDDLVRLLQGQSALAGCGCCSSAQSKPATTGRRLEIC